MLIFYRQVAKLFYRPQHIVILVPELVSSENKEASFYYDSIEYSSIGKYHYKKLNGS